MQHALGQACTPPPSEATLTDIAREAATATAETARDRGLLRAVGTWGLAVSIVNGVVGAGIFSLPAEMARAAGPGAPWAYVACGLVMAAVVTCFAEAGSRVPTSGGPYGYVEAAFGPMPGFVAGVLLWLSSVLACGGIAAALGDAVTAFFPAVPAPPLRAGLIVAVFVAFAWVNVRGVGAGARLIGAATVIKLAPIALFLVVGAAAILMTGMAPRGAAPAGPGAGFGQAVILALFAFCGMETPLGVSGEVANPARTIPRALVLSMGFVVPLYIAIQLVAQGLLGDRLGAAKDPLADAIGVVDPGLGIVILAGAAISRLGWIASDIFGAPRVLFAFARDGMLPRGLAAIDPRTRAPWAAICLHSAIAALLALTGTFVTLAILSTLATAGLYFLACAAAWRLRARGIAVLGRPLDLRLLPVAAVVGMASMVVLILLAKPGEIAAFVAVVVVSALLFAARWRGGRA